MATKTRNSKKTSKSKPMTQPAKTALQNLAPRQQRAVREAATTMVRGRTEKRLAGQPLSWAKAAQLARADYENDSELTAFTRELAGDPIIEY